MRVAGGYTGMERGRAAAGRQTGARCRFAPSGRASGSRGERPKIDRVACPWLIRRFIDPQARILYVDPDQVLEASEGDRRDPVRHRGHRAVATRASAARSTPCSSCSGSRASRRWRGLR